VFMWRGHNWARWLLTCLALLNHIVPQAHFIPSRMWVVHRLLFGRDCLFPFPPASICLFSAHKTPGRT
jgi:hypothetical protein